MKTQKLFPVSFILMLTIFLKSSTASGANLAPGSFAGSLLTISVSNGVAPFTARGTYRFFTSAAGTNYTALGASGALSSGSCQYTIGTNSVAVAALVDSKSGASISLRLTFASTTNGAAALTNGSKFQTGSFTLASCISTPPPHLFLPGLAGKQFQCYLSGQPGSVYSVETSTNLVRWQSWSNVPLADLTTNVADANSRPGLFYRARLNSTAFAPANVTNQTFNLTVTEGKAPLATNGICQWAAGASDNSYQILGGPGTTGSSGHYTYTRTGPDTGLLSCQDSAAGTLYQQLVFTSTESGYFYATNVTGFEAGTFTMADGPVQFLGNLKFTPDTAPAHSVYYPASGVAVASSVTNSAGWIWTLSFPTNALLTPRTITMTPMANLNAGNSRVPVSAGVQLSPDGIQFAAAVTLSVKPPTTLGAHATLLMTADDGSAEYFVAATKVANTYSTTLLHFTDAAVTDSSDAIINSLIPQAQAAYQNAVTQVRALKRPIVIPPEPPDYDWKCDSNPDGDAQIEAYQQALFAKETEAISRLLSAGRTLQLLGGQTDPDPFTTALELVETAMYRKVDSLFSQYSGNPKKCMAVSRIALNLMRQDQLLGGAGRPDWWQQIQSWCSRVEDYYWDQLRNQHMYSKALVLPQIERTLGLLGVETDVDSLFDRLNKALKFNLTLDMNLSFKDWDSDGQMNNSVTEEVYGSAHLQAGVSTPYPLSTNQFRFVSGAWADPIDDCSYALDPGQSSIWHVSLGLQACAEPRQVILVLQGPFPPFETWTGCDEVSVPNPWLGDIYGTAVVCQSQPNNGAGGLFRFPLQDGVAEVVNQSVSGDSSQGLCADPLQSAKATILIILQHSPE